MFAFEFKLRLTIMVERPELPPIRAMASAALLAKGLLVAVISLVTIETGCPCVFVLVHVIRLMAAQAFHAEIFFALLINMAGDAFCLFVRSIEWEFCFLVVVESTLAPGFCGMAGLTFLAH